VCGDDCDQTAHEPLRASSHRKNTGLPACGRRLPLLCSRQSHDLTISWLFNPILSDFDPILLDAI